MHDQSDRSAAPCDLSIVIPAYNEARRIRRTLEAVRACAAGAGARWEVVVVDDGSRDGTQAVVAGFDPGPLRLRLLVNERNRGKGHAVRRGMLAAAGDRVLMCDADLSAPIEEVYKLLAWVERGYDVVIGSRDLPDSRLAPPQPPLRRLAARAFRWLRRLIMLRGIQDTQCGFKLFRRAAAREIFSHATVNGWLFDCEALGLAERFGYRIREVGIVWGNHPDTRVRPLRETFTALPRLLSIRRRLGRVRRVAQ